MLEMNSYVFLVRFNEDGENKFCIHTLKYGLTAHTLTSETQLASFLVLLPKI